MLSRKEQLNLYTLDMSRKSLLFACCLSGCTGNPLRSGAILYATNRLIVLCAYSAPPSAKTPHKGNAKLSMCRADLISGCCTSTRPLRAGINHTEFHGFFK
ncbi:hypothetical protein MRB53_039531 [Persea americana]|nr:hypothetical protein MRB53_039531 [Persea americana]